MKSTTKMRELREKGEGDLTLRERELAEQLFALRLQKVTGQLEKPSKIRGAKRELARVLTVRSELRRGEPVTTKATAEPKPKPTPKAAVAPAAKAAAKSRTKSGTKSDTKSGAKGDAKSGAKAKKEGAGR
jgi:large subunit ribosomal protein L29